MRWRLLLARNLQTARGGVGTANLNVTDRNARYLYIEVFWASLLSAATTFNAPFALRLGATNAEIGLLSSIPALLALVITIPAGHFISRRARRQPVVIWSLFLYRLGFLFVTLIPWLPVAAKGGLLVGLLIAFTSPAHVFGVAWNSMLADVIPEANRARVFATRNILVAFSATAGIYLAGQWLEHGPYPFNYQVLYAVGLIASMVSLLYILKLQVPDSVVSAAPSAVRQSPSPRAVWRGLREAANHEPDFVRLVINTLAYGMGLWMIGPLYILYFVRVLGANEGWIGLNGTLGNLTPAIGFYLWQRAIARWGENRVLKISISLIGVYPLLVGLTPNLSIILLWTALNGLLSPGVSLAHFNMLLKICPAAQRPVYMGIYTSIMNVGAFVMPLIGVYFANLLGIAPVLVAGGVICLLGSSLFRIRALRTPDSVQARLSASYQPVTDTV